MLSFPHTFITKIYNSSGNFYLRTGTQETKTLLTCCSHGVDSFKCASLDVTGRQLMWSQKLWSMLSDDRGKTLTLFCYTKFIAEEER